MNRLNTALRKKLVFEAPIQNMAHKEAEDIKGRLNVIVDRMRKSHIHIIGALDSDGE